MDIPAETVAGILHQTAAVIEDDRINGAAMSLECRVRAPSSAPIMRE